MNPLFKIVQDLLRKVTCRWCGHVQSAKDEAGRPRTVCKRCGKPLSKDGAQS
ncbi:hypothetical protein [Oceanidesulfovibrio marinus]|uniref:hypothetical protein n=1 Tax=Oceanidesulfovibrio marinus TaxID=370038 RepID=UPI00129469AF|nr:hypothetical protein [Oceanidesulfovibrio marinus]